MAQSRAAENCSKLVAIPTVTVTVTAAVAAAAVVAAAARIILPFNHLVIVVIEAAALEMIRWTLMVVHPAVAPTPLLLPPPPLQQIPRDCNNYNLEELTCNRHVMVIKWTSWVPTIRHRLQMDFLWTTNRLQ
jgi:hypothetical protein